MRLCILLLLLFMLLIIPSIPVPLLASILGQ
jgi:hypothetical protein